MGLKLVGFLRPCTSLGLFLMRTGNRLLEPTTHIDDEYSKAGMRDPKILITTSRDPSSRLMQFAKVSDC